MGLPVDTKGDGRRCAECGVMVWAHVTRARTWVALDGSTRCFEFSGLFYEPDDHAPRYEELPVKRRL